MTARTALTARSLAALLAAAGLPCVTLVPDEAAAAAIPAAPAQEGLRIVDGTLPVRVAYPIPPADTDAHHAAQHRRDSHMLWLHDFIERQRWSTRRDADNEWITISPDPWPATYVLDGHECFRATGRRADEDLGSWVVLWIVEDADAWADAIEAEVAAEIARAPKNRRFATPMQQQRLDGAKRIREEGPRPQARLACLGCGGAIQHDGDVGGVLGLDAQTGFYVEYDAGPGWRGKRYQCTTAGTAHEPADAPVRRTVRATELDQNRADAHVAGLYNGCPNPGVRYEAAPITAYGACVTCYCPMFEAGGRWWHHTGGYPAECPGPRPPRDLPLEPGAWEFTSISMTCGYCGESVSWPETLRSWVRLTGVWSLGVQLVIAETGPAASGRPGDLVVLAETEGIALRPGEHDILAHHCAQIPHQVREQYADEISAALCRGTVATASEA